MISEYYEEDVSPPKEIDELLPNIMLFSFLWGVGGPLHEDARNGFQQFLSDLAFGENVVEKYKLDDYVGEYKPFKLGVKMPDTKSLYDVFFDKIKFAWINWTRIVEQYIVPQNCSFNEIIVPTEDSIRVASIMKMLV